MKLQIEPIVGPCDEKLRIRISDLRPSAEVKISASMSLPWAPNVPFESSACFISDHNGSVDLSKQKPDSGSYDFVDSMGLIVSLKRTRKGKLKEIAENISVNHSIFTDIVVECEGDRATARLERLFTTGDTKSQTIRDEFVGEFFFTENSGNKTILFLGGSGGGVVASLPIASLLASHGFNVLTVAYFEEKGLPDKLSEIPLEYFEGIFKWIADSPLTNGEDLYVLCMSKGAELALILGPRYPSIKKIAAWAPHAYCFQGIAFKNVSSWTYQGKSLHFIQLKNRWFLADMINCFVKNKPFGYAHTFRKGLDVATNKQAARIKVEESSADLLMFAGEKDNIWNSCDGCEQIMADLQAHDFGHEYDYIAYKGAGHPFYAPYVIPLVEMTTVKMAPRLTLSTGGSLEANTHAQVDSWAKTIQFFKQ